MIHICAYLICILYVTQMISRRIPISLLYSPCGLQLSLWHEVDKSTTQLLQIQLEGKYMYVNEEADRFHYYLNRGLTLIFWGVISGFSTQVLCVGLLSHTEEYKNNKICHIYHFLCRILVENPDFGGYLGFLLVLKGFKHFTSLGVTELLVVAE